MGRRGNGIKMRRMGIRKVEGKEGKRMDAKGATSGSMGGWDDMSIQINIT